jgi:hypothetical protein
VGTADSLTHLFKGGIGLLANDLAHQRYLSALAVRPPSTPIGQRGNLAGGATASEELFDK